MLRFIILLVGVLAPFVISYPTTYAPCGPVCEIYCLYGHVLDKNGCPTCACNSSPCKYGQAPLKDRSCGRGLNQKKCPLNYECVIASNDAYAVCCPSKRQTTTTVANTVTKPGACPKTSTGIGPCFALCTDDSDCTGDLKCCGNCPRVCVEPDL